jgi:hypothetical protein
MRLSVELSLGLEVQVRIEFNGDDLPKMIPAGANHFPFGGSGFDQRLEAEFPAVLSYHALLVQDGRGQGTAVHLPALENVPMGQSS